MSDLTTPATGSETLQDTAVEEAAAVSATAAKRIGALSVRHILFIILDQSSDVFYNTKKTLSSVSANVGGAEVFLNAYNPFTSGKATDQDGPQGVVRAAITGILATINKIVERNIVFVGPSKNAVGMVNLLAARITQALSTASVFKATDILVPPNLGKIPDENGVETDTVELPPIAFSDVLQVTSWVSFDAQADDGIVDDATVYTALKINSGAMYDSRDPQKHVERAMNIISRSIESIDSQIAEDVFVGVLVKSTDVISDSRIHDLALNLTDTLAFSPMSRIEAGAVDWLSSNALPKVFGTAADVLLFRPLVQEEDEGSAETDPAD